MSIQREKSGIQTQTQEELLQKNQELINRLKELVDAGIIDQSDFFVHFNIFLEEYLKEHSKTGTPTKVFEVENKGETPYKSITLPLSLHMKGKYPREDINSFGGYNSLESRVNYLISSSLVYEIDINNWQKLLPIPDYTNESLDLEKIPHFSYFSYLPTNSFPRLMIGTSIATDENMGKSQKGALNRSFIHTQFGCAFQNETDQVFEAYVKGCPVAMNLYNPILPLKKQDFQDNGANQVSAGFFRKNDGQYMNPNEYFNDRGEDSLRLVIAYALFFVKSLSDNKDSSQESSQFYLQVPLAFSQRERVLVADLVMTILSVKGFFNNQARMFSWVTEGVTEKPATFGFTSTDNDFKPKFSATFTACENVSTIGDDVDLLVSAFKSSHSEGIEVISKIGL